MSTIAFLGLGTMGRGMVTNLLKAGHKVTVWNRTNDRAEPLVRLGAHPAPTIRDAVAGAEFIMYCLSNDEAVRDVVLAENGVASSADASAIVLDLSTVDPGTTLEESRALAERGIRFLDAPVFGSKAEAEAGKVWVVAGGDRSTFDACQDILSAISASTHYMGPVGSGSKMKLVGNLLVAAQFESLGEALSLAKKTGLNLADVLDVIHVTDFNSPLYDSTGSAILAGDYAPNFALKLMLKDARLIAALAQRSKVNVPGTEAVVSTLERAMQAGLGEENASALVKVIAEDAGIQLAATA